MEIFGNSGQNLWLNKYDFWHFGIKPKKLIFLLLQRMVLLRKLKRHRNRKLKKLKKLEKNTLPIGRQVIKNKEKNKMKKYTLDELTDEYIGKKGSIEREQFDFELRLDILGD